MANGVCTQTKLIDMQEFHFPFYQLDALVLGSGRNGPFSEITTAYIAVISPFPNQSART